MRTGNGPPKFTDCRTGRPSTDEENERPDPWFPDRAYWVKITLPMFSKIGGQDVPSSSPSKIDKSALQRYGKETTRGMGTPNWVLVHSVIFNKPAFGQFPSTQKSIFSGTSSDVAKVSQPRMNFVLPCDICFDFSAGDDK